MNNQSDESQESSAPAKSDLLSGGEAEAANEFLGEGQGAEGDASTGLLASLSQPRTLSLVAGSTALLAASVAAFLWLPRRPSILPGVSSNGASSGFGPSWMQVLGSGRAPRQPTTMQDRLTMLTGRSSERARSVGTELLTRAGQMRRPPKQTRWQIVRNQAQGAAARTEGNRFTLAALVVAASLVGAARWIDSQQRAHTED